MSEKEQHYACDSSESPLVNALRLYYGEVFPPKQVASFFTRWNIPAQPTSSFETYERPGQLVPVGMLPALFELSEATERLPLYQAILSQGNEQDRQLALYIIGEMDKTEVVDVLHPFLFSSLAQERWLSAVSLGKRHDERAFPVLLTMLSEFFPSPSRPALMEQQAWFEEMRCDVAFLLDRWKESALVPFFRDALIACIQAEQTLPIETVVLTSMTFLRSAWCEY